MLYVTLWYTKEDCSLISGLFIRRWKFNGDGACTEMPSTPFCRNVAVTALPCAEKDGFVWVWPGEGTPTEVCYQGEGG